MASPEPTARWTGTEAALDTLGRRRRRGDVDRSVSDRNDLLVEDGEISSLMLLLLLRVSPVASFNLLDNNDDDTRFCCPTEENDAGNEVGCNENAAALPAKKKLPLTLLTGQEARAVSMKRTEVTIVARG